MNRDDAIALYRAHLVRYARHALPLAEAVAFLQGALEAARGNCDLTDIKRAYDSLRTGDDQLELIEPQQGTFNFGGPNGKKP